MGRIDDCETFVKGLITQPETIQTITKNETGENTDTKLSRLKACKLFKQHRIYEYTLDGTRQGKKLFFHPQKEYLVIIRRSRSGFSYYYCKSVTEGEIGIELEDAHRLEKSMWVKEDGVMVPYQEVHKCF
jgi:hypothetical protein